MRVNEKIERITPDTLICGIDVGKTVRAKIKMQEMAKIKMS